MGGREERRGGGGGEKPVKIREEYKISFLKKKTQIQETAVENCLQDADPKT